MSAKQAATYHGADIVTRLRANGPESDYDGVMQEAASEIEKLRGERRTLRDYDELDHLPKDAVVIDRLNESYQCIIAGEGVRGSVWSGDDIVGVDDMELPALLLWAPHE